MRDSAKNGNLDDEIENEIRNKLDLIEVWYGVWIDSSNITWGYR